MFSQIYYSVLYQPLLNLLVGIYNIIPGHDIGITIVLLTVIIRFGLYPFTKSSLEAQRKLQALQPKLDALKKELKGNKEMQAMEMMKLYKENKINPLSSCLPILLQLPILIALYHVFQASLSGAELTGVYNFIPNPGVLQNTSFGLNLAHTSVVLAVLAAIAQYFSSKLMLVKKPAIQTEASKDEEMAAIMNKQMMYLMPGLTLIIGWKIPAGLTLYWLVTTVFMIMQQLIIQKQKKEPVVEVVQR